MKDIWILLFGILIFGACNNAGDGVTLKPINSSIKGKKLNAEIVAGSTSHGNVVTIKVPKDGYSEAIEMNELIDSFELVELETSRECIIGEIDKLLVTPNGYIILDKGNKKVFLFGLDGAFKKKIGSAGKGPKEYVSVYDVTIDNKEKRIILNDLDSRKFVYFDFDGNFIESKPTYFLFQHWEMTSDFAVFNLGRSYNTKVPSIDKHRLAIGNLQLDSLCTFFHYERDNRCTYAAHRPLKKFNDKLYYYNFFVDTIYQVKGNGVEAGFALDFQGKGWPVKAGESISDDMVRKIIQHYSYFDGNYVLSEDFLFFRVYKEMRHLDVYYSLKTGNMKAGGALDHSLGRFLGMSFVPPMTVTWKNEFVSVIEPFKVLQNEEYINKDPKLNEGGRVKEVMQSIKLEDNPLLLIYKLKEF
ncbi:6-bladed beta-propeller [Puteibacter caeruleilacunae]|nr:6-bladed beta-propeller [Puteibacter caeruleilacunae]